MMFTSENTHGDSARLEDYIRAIKLRKWVVISLALLGLGAALLFTRTKTNFYTATATVVLSPTPVGSVNTNLVSPNLEKEREIILSNRTATDVVDQLGLDDEPRALLRNVKVAFRPDSDVLNIDYTNTNAEVASAYANAFAAAYVERREEVARSYYASRIAQTEANIQALEDRSAQVSTEIDRLKRDRLDIILEITDPIERAGPLTEVDDQLASLRAERTDLLSETRTLGTILRRDQGTIASRSPAAQLLRTSEPPEMPDGLNQSLLKVAGLVFGLIAGVVAAFFLERLDTTAREDTDVALALDTDVVGSIPTLGFGNRSGSSALVMLTHGGSSRVSAAREAFRRLRTSILFLNSTEGVQSILVTSASPAEGKSTISANLSLAFAQSGKNVVLVNADLRRPTQEERFGIPKSNVGLSEYLGGDDELTAIPVPNVERLWLLPAGSTPANPGELLGSPRFKKLIQNLTEEMDFIIIDTPPILSTADAIAAAGAVDGVVAVVDSRRTETSDLLQVRADLQRSGARLIGAVLNRRKHRSGGLFKRDRYAYYSSKAK